MINLVDSYLKHVNYQAKRLRSHLNGGVNVARAIGDINQTGAPGQSLVIHKPKITVNKVKPGDTLILACDGLKDYVDESKIASIVGAKDSLHPSLARRLVNAALGNMSKNGGDNVTIVAINISANVETQSA